MTLQKPDQDKYPHQCPYCFGYNCEYYNQGDLYEDVMGCKDCDSTWFEYDDEWESVFQRGKIIK